MLSVIWDILRSTHLHDQYDKSVLFYFITELLSIFPVIINSSEIELNNAT